MGQCASFRPTAPPAPRQGGHAPRPIQTRGNPSQLGGAERSARDRPAQALSLLLRSPLCRHRAMRSGVHSHAYRVCCPSFGNSRSVPRIREDRT